MKESYLTSEPFRLECRKMVRLSDELGREAFTEGQTALLVVDMQRYFLAPESHAYLPSAAGIVAGLNELSAAFAASGLPVIFTRHVNTEDDAGSLGLWWNDLIKVESPLSEICDELDTSVGTVVEKRQYDAFYGTVVEETLAALGVKRVVITGVATHLCCETTARSAFVRGFEVTFPVDGTATYDADHHLATLLNLSHGFATMATVRSIIDAARA